MNTTTQFEVIVTFLEWRQALLPMLSNPDLIATGTLMRDPERMPTGLLAQEMTTSSQTGADFPPLADWITVAVPRGELPSNPGKWLQRMQPRFAQLLVVLLIGHGPQRGSWRGWTIERGVIRPLAGFRVVGPGMIHAELAQTEDRLHEPDGSRWSRLQGAVGTTTFAKLRSAKVAVIGCSRTGSLAAGMFAALGVRRLTLVDGDLVESHNLDSAMLLTDTDRNTNKALALSRRLVAYRPDIAIKALPHPLTARTTEIALGGTDLIVTCVDQDSPRLRVAHYARSRLIPHLDIGTGVTHTDVDDHKLAADIRLLLPGLGCLRCVGGLADLDQAEYEIHAPTGALPRRPPEPWDGRGRLGSLITLNGLAVSVGVQSWLDLLDSSLAGSIWHRLRWQAGRSLEVDSGLMTAAADCRTCHHSLS